MVLIGAKNVIQAIGISFIIGQSGPQTLALFHAPQFLPESVNGALFENHWGYWIAGLLVAVILFVASGSRPKLRPYSYGVAAAILLWMAAAHLVDTRYERLYAVNRAILDATINKDVNGVLDHLDDKFMFGEINKDQLAATLKTMMPALAITSHSIEKFEISPVGSDTQVTVNVWTAFGKDGNLPTGWDLIYTEEPDGSFKLLKVASWRINNEPQKLGFPEIPGF